MAQLDNPTTPLDADRLAPLRSAVRAFTELADSRASEAQFLSEGRQILSKLIAQDT